MPCTANLALCLSAGCCYLANLMTQSLYLFWKFCNYSFNCFSRNLPEFYKIEPLLQSYKHKRPKMIRLWLLPRWSNKLIIISLLIHTAMNNVTTSKYNNWQETHVLVVVVRRFWHATHDCVAPYVHIILHRGRFWAKSAASGSVRWWCFRSCWMVLSHVMRGRPSCLLQSAGAEANRILLASALSSMQPQ